MNKIKSKKLGDWQDYGMRMYSPWQRRFPTPDPLIVYGKEYPWYSPYQFAGNKPIWAVDLDGLEPGVVLGNSKQVKAVNEHANNVNYIGMELQTLAKSYLQIKSHKENGNDVKVIYVQTHGSSGAVYIGEGKDGVLKTDGVLPGSIYEIDDVSVWSGDFDFFFSLSDKEKSESLLTNPKVKAISDLQKLASLLDEDGVLILGACESGKNDYANEGDDLLLKIGKLTNRKVLTNKDYTISIDSQGGVLNTGRSAGFFSEGWNLLEKGAISTMKIAKDLILKSEGDLYEFKEQQ